MSNGADRTGRLPGIEAARGIAALLVVLRHTSTILSGPGDYNELFLSGFFQFGRAGVDFFFVLSGFIIAYVHAGDIGHPGRLVAFWRKRLLRIYPPYWAAFALLGLLLAFSPTAGRSERDPGLILSSILLTPDNREPILGVAWSLRHEMLFYALFATLLLRKWAGCVVLTAWAGGIIACAVSTAVVSGADSAGAGMPFGVFDLDFFVGMGVAVLVRTWPGWGAATSLLGGLAVFLATGMRESFGLVMPPEWPPQVLGYALGSGMMIYGAAVLDLGGRWRVPGPLLVLGTASYSIYLTHTLTVQVVQHLLRPARALTGLPHAAAFLACVGAALVVGVVFSGCVERPMLAWGRRWAGAPRATSGANAA